ncbi:MAG: hydrogenase maturation protease [Candidatus Omnitrophota bacterium]|nr:MAG: hydrogenase maturation protease [Candidatus Omnitrophota bacterium]
MRCLAFDLGRVVFDFDYTIALNKIKEKVSVPIEKIIEDLFYNDFAKDFEKGLASSAQFYTKFKTAYAAHLTYEEFVDIWSDIFYPKEEIIKLIERLKVIYPVYLISNINELHFQHLLVRYPHVFALFDGLVLSFQVKSVKPERKIYEVLREVSGENYENIIYIDDRHDLIVAAEKLNLHCLEFGDYNQLIADLASLGVSVLQESEISILTFLKDKISSHKNPCIVGLGNILQSDDGVGAHIARGIKDKVHLQVFDVGLGLENYLGKLAQNVYDFFLVIDAGEFQAEEHFALFSPNQISDISLYFTHDSSLKLAIQYLQKEKIFDILIFTIKPRIHSFGEQLSEPVARAAEMIKKFFVRNFSQSLKKNSESTDGT